MMKTKGLGKFLLFVLLLYGASFLGYLLFSMNQKIPVQNIEVLAEPSSIDDSVYVMNTGSYASDVMKIDREGNIISKNTLFNRKGNFNVEYEGSKMVASDGKIYAVLRWTEIKSFNITRRDIVQLDEKNLNKSPKVLYTYQGDQLVNIKELTCENDYLYITSCSSEGKKLYVDKINLNLDEIKIERIKNVDAPIGDTFYIAGYYQDNILYAATKGGRLYTYSDGDISTLVYPTPTGNSIVDPGVITIMEGYSNGDGALFYDINQRKLFNCTGINGHVVEVDINKTPILKESFNFQSGYEVLELTEEGEKGTSIITTSTSLDNVTDMVICIKDDVIKIESLKNTFGVAAKDSLTAGTLIFVGLMGVSGIGLFVYHIIRKGRKIIYKFTIIIIPILLVALTFLEYDQSNIIRNVLLDTKHANAISVNNVILNNIDKDLAAKLGDQSAYWDPGIYQKLYESINIEPSKLNEFEDIAGEMFKDSVVVGTGEGYIANELFVVRDNKVYTGVSKNIAHMIPVGIEYYEGTEELFNEVVKTGQPKMGDIATRNKRARAYVSPIKKDGNVIGLLVTTVNVYTITAFLQDCLKVYILIGLGLIVAILIPMYFMFKVVLRPLGELSRAVEEVVEGNYSVRMADTSNDEFSFIRARFNKMCEQLSGSIYRVQNMSKSYFRFVPRHIFSILNKEDILDVKFGDRKNVECIMTMHTLHNFMDVEKKMLGSGGDKLTRIMDFTNRYFNIVYTGLSKLGGSLISNDLRLNRIETVFYDNSRAAVEYAIDVMKKLSANEYLNDSNRLDTSMIIYKTNMLYVIAGEEERTFPFVLSTDTEQLQGVLFSFRQSGVKVIITQEIKEALESWQELSTRHIGYSTIDESKTRIEMYEVLDACDLVSKQQKESTKESFEEGLELFYKGEFYQSRNVFANIVKKSPLDNVARWYLFASDKYYELGKAKKFELYGDSDIVI